MENKIKLIAALAILLATTGCTHEFFSSRIEYKKPENPYIKRRLPTMQNSLPPEAQP